MMSTMSNEELESYLESYMERQREKVYRAKHQLRPCPFCGNPNVVLKTKPGRNGFRARYFVLCDYDEGGCGAEGGWRHYREEAETCWNERRRKYRDG